MDTTERIRNGHLQMEPILRETLEMARTQPEVIRLPLSRVNEFVQASFANHSTLTNLPDEMERLQQRCLKGEAKVWGIPVVFESDESQPVASDLVADLDHANGR